MKPFLLFFCLAGLVFSAVGQTNPRTEIDLEAFVQRLFATQKETLDYEELYESLLQAYLHPLDLNRATPEELAALYVLTSQQLQSFSDYRKKNGPLLSIYELQAIPHFDLSTIYNLLPFVQVYENGSSTDPRPFWQRLKTAPTHMLLIRYNRTVEQVKGFVHPDSGRGTPAYQGSPSYAYLRYRLHRPADFSVGITLEKDAGEPIHWHPASQSYGADFASYHIMLENKGRWKRILAGDYQLQIGQGLLLSAGFSVGKGTETVQTLRRPHLGIRPYTSTLENGYLRGAAATYSLGQWQLTGFYSYTSRDASIDPLTGTASALQTTGYHRTASEIASKRSLREQTLGTDLTYTPVSGRFQIGSAWVYSLFDKALQPASRRYNQFVFRGNKMLAVSLHGHYIWQNIHLFGEVAHSENNGWGMLYGLMGSFSAKISLSLLFRHYDQRFHTLFGHAFGENTRNSNEQGMYWGLKWMPWRKLTCTLYYDTYRFPWLRYRADAPSRGFDYMAQVTYQLPKNLRLHIQYREAHNQQNNETPILPMHVLVATLLRQYQAAIHIQATERLSLQTRLQGSSFRKHTQTKGFVVAQDVQWTSSRWQWTSRFALFDTDDFDNRQYLFEKDVLYSFSMPAYYRRGFRFYFLWKYELSSRLCVWTRFSRTFLADASTIGSGQDEIQGLQRTDVKVQIQYRFR